jgi:prepilin-type processing-associated H-X9-DG protein
MGGGCPGPCSINQQGNGCGYRNTEVAINTNLLPMQLADENRAPFGSRHPGGTHFLFADGHVDFIGDQISLETYRALSTIDSGEIISAY